MLDVLWTRVWEGSLVFSSGRLAMMMGDRSNRSGKGGGLPWGAPQHHLGQKLYPPLFLSGPKVGLSLGGGTDLHLGLLTLDRIRSRRDLRSMWSGRSFFLRCTLLRWPGLQLCVSVCLPEHGCGESSAAGN